MTDFAASLLFVDDDPATLQSVPTLVAYRLPFLSVQTSATVDDALERLRHCDFDVVLTDVGLWGSSGLDIVRQGRVVRPETAFVAVTGYASDAVLRDAIAAGIYGFLRKPFDRDELALVLRQAIHMRQLQGHLARHERLSRQAARQMQRVQRVLSELPTGAMPSASGTRLDRTHQGCERLLRKLHDAAEERLRFHERMQALWGRGE
jgi:DNA-binding NtrC family response regulator